MVEALLLLNIEIRELKIKSVLLVKAECVVTTLHVTVKINGSLRLNLTQHGETHQVQTQ